MLGYECESKHSGPPQIGESFWVHHPKMRVGQNEPNLGPPTLSSSEYDVLCLQILCDVIWNLIDQSLMFHKYLCSSKWRVNCVSTIIHIWIFQHPPRFLCSAWGSQPKLSARNGFPAGAFVAMDTEYINYNIYIYLLPFYKDKAGICFWKWWIHSKGVN